jgi:hypothetical protein
VLGIFGVKKDSEYKKSFINNMQDLGFKVKKLLIPFEL